MAQFLNAGNAFPVARVYFELRTMLLPGNGSFSGKSITTSREMDNYSTHLELMDPIKWFTHAMRAADGPPKRSRRMLCCYAKSIGNGNQFPPVGNPALAEGPQKGHCGCCDAERTGGAAFCRRPRGGLAALRAAAGVNGPEPEQSWGFPPETIILK